MAQHFTRRSFKGCWINGMSGNTTGQLTDPVEMGLLNKTTEPLKLLPREEVYRLLKYNMSPKSEQLEKTILQRAIFNYQWRHPKVKPVAKQVDMSESI